MLLLVCDTLCSCVFSYKSCSTLANDIYGLKSIAAYRSGLEINVNVSRKDAEEGLIDVLQG